jgi:putative SOS response-associated peptidase YedK
MQLKFLHDRTPIMLDPDSEDLRTWLGPGRHEWSEELQLASKAVWRQAGRLPRERGRWQSQQQLVMVYHYDRQQGEQVQQY